MSANRSIRCEKASKTFCPPTATAHVGAALPAVRRGPGQGERQGHPQQLPHGLSARAAENQANVAGPALPDGQGRAAALAIATAYRPVATAPRGIANTMIKTFKKEAAIVF